MFSYLKSDVCFQKALFKVFLNIQEKKKVGYFGDQVFLGEKKIVYFHKNKSKVFFPKSLILPRNVIYISRSFIFKFGGHVKR